MSALEIYERDVTLEHIEGYLYAIQEIENRVRYSPGSINEYSINQISPKEGMSDSQNIIAELLDRIGHVEEITEPIRQNFISNMEEFNIEDWKKEFYTTLHRWFIGKHISEKNIRIAGLKHLNRFNNWNVDKKNTYLARIKTQENRARLRLENSKIATEVFLEMIERFMYESFTCKKYDLSKIKKHSELYPRAMSFYCGWHIDLYHLKNRKKNIYLHFGQLLN